jgi:O-antigen ligase
MNKRPHGIRHLTRQPLRIIGVLWPLALLAPFMPGLPKPALNGLPWRQELIISLLLCATLALLAKQSKSFAMRVLTVPRRDLCLLIPPILFVLWSAASILWSGAVSPAIHHTLEWSGYILFFALMRHVAARPRLLRASFITFGGVVFVISVSCIIGSWGTPNSLFRENGVGEPLAIAVPLFTTLALTLRSRRAALLCGTIALLAWLAVVQMLERAPFIGAICALILIAVLSAVVPQWRPRSALRVAVLSVSFAALFAFEAASIPAVIETTIIPVDKAGVQRNTVVARLQESGAGDDSMRVRFLFWAVAWEMWRAHPFNGVGANNYEVAFPEARRVFAEKHPASSLVEMNEGFLAQRAHNEYVQILAELGLIGFALFAIFCVALMWSAARAIRYARSPLVQGAIGSLVVFALSSGASSVSFRWAGSGLVFFFAAAIVSRFALTSAPHNEATINLAPAFVRAAPIAALALALLMIGGISAQAMNVMLHGAAQASVDSRAAEKRYTAALFWNPYDVGTHYDYGLLLYSEGRSNEAVAHLRYAVQRGFNSSICYEYLAGAEISAGDMAAAEKTLAYAVSVYPRSVFLRVRHAAMLAAVNKTPEAENEDAAAFAINPRMARGWQQLINSGIDAATQAASKDAGIANPGELLPGDGVFAVLAEDKQRCCLSANFFNRQQRAATLR